MSNEQKHGFFSRILKTPSTSEPADSPPDSTAETASSDMMTATAAVPSAALAPETAESAAPEQEIATSGRGIFRIPANSMFFNLWDEWQQVSPDPQPEAVLVMEKPGIQPVPMSDKEIEEEKQNVIYF